MQNFLPFGFHQQTYLPIILQKQVYHQLIHLQQIFHQFLVPPPQVLILFQLGRLKLLVLIIMQNLFHQQSLVLFQLELEQPLTPVVNHFILLFFTQFSPLFLFLFYFNRFQTLVPFLFYFNQFQTLVPFQIFIYPSNFLHLQYLSPVFLRLDFVYLEFLLLVFH